MQAVALSDETDTTDLKRAFALALLLRDDPLTAAQETLPQNRTFQIFMAMHWPNDEYVLIAKRELIEKHGPAFFLPDKYDVGRRLATMALAAERANMRGEALQSWRLYVDVMGIVEKPTGGGTSVAIHNTNALTNTNNRVMIVQDHGSDEDWERKVEAQQRTLIASASE